MRAAVSIVFASLALVAAGCGSDSSSTSASPTTTPTSEESAGGGKTELSKAEAAKLSKPKVKVPKGPPPKQLVEKESRPGTGATAEAGDEVTVQYVGVDYKTGKQFDASWDRGEPFTFNLGGGEVIVGWDEGVEGMKVGGQRELIIPPELAYGNQQVGTIKPNSTLVFVIDLLAAK